MWQSVHISGALPLLLSYLLLIASAMSVECILHSAGLAWMSRFLGIAGTVLMAFSFGYSARKKSVIGHGSMNHFLRVHGHAGWIGTLLILVHSGVHFNALLPWMASALLMLVTASGHVGQYLVSRIREEVKWKKKQYGIGGDGIDALEQQHFRDALTLKAFAQWRFIHIPLVTFLLLLTFLHLASISFFMNWR